MERELGYFTLKQIDQLTAENIRLKSSLISLSAQLHSKNESIIIVRMGWFMAGAALVILVYVTFGSPCF